MAPFARVHRVRHESGKMNKLEQAYAASLQMMLLAGEIHSHRFEAVKFTLACRTTYTPDFMVLNNDNVIEFHEVKGFWEDDARVKIKVTARLFPEFQFKAFTRKKGLWVEESF